MAVLSSYHRHVCVLRMMVIISVCTLYEILCAFVVLQMTGIYVDMTLFNGVLPVLRCLICSKVFYLRWSTGIVSNRVVVQGKSKTYDHIHFTLLCVS